MLYYTIFYINVCQYILYKCMSINMYVYILILEPYCSSYMPMIHLDTS